jgi:hypothetical protein
MTLEELKAALRLILQEEQKAEVNWVNVEAMCLNVVTRLNTEPEPKYSHDAVYHFVEDADVRQKDEGYAERQRARLSDWLEARP